MTPTNPPFRAEHVGSLLRPRRLKDSAKALAAGTIAADDYLAVLDQEVSRVVKLQEDVGLQSITDGEFSRIMWFGFFFERMDGFKYEQSAFSFVDAEGQEYPFQTGRTVAKMRRRGSICKDDFLRVHSTTRATAKATIPAPTAFHFFLGDDSRDPGVYPDMQDWWADLLAVFDAEIQELADSGCRYLQFDEVPLAMLCDSRVAEQSASMGMQPETIISDYIDVINRARSACPPDITVGMHMCRGNLRSRWLAEGGYEPVAERVFNELNIDAYFLEYDTDRAGDFEPLKYLPDDKTVVLGLVSTKTPELESPEELKQRIHSASRYVPLDRLALSPQCGFASVAGGNPLTEDEQMAKLRLVVDVAGDVWR